MGTVSRTIIVIGLWAVAQVWGTRLNQSGFITANTTWNADTVVLTNNVGVNNGILTILPGTVIMGSRSSYVLSDSAHGAIQAIGTLAKMIKFQGFSRITISALVNDTLSTFQYCDLEGLNPGFEFRNPVSDNTTYSRPLIDHCLIQGGGYTNVYVTGGASPTISNCYIDGGTTGIFVHGCGNKMKVLNCAIYNVSGGIVSASMLPWSNTPGHVLTVDHVTFYNCTMPHVLSGVGCADSNAICTLNDPGILNLTNCILDSTAKYGIYDNNHHDPLYLPNKQFWTINEDYNCFYRCRLNDDPDTSIGPHCFDGNPLFVNPRQADFSYPNTSPCWGAGSDGSNLGFQASGWTTDINDKMLHAIAAGPALSVTLSANPFITATSFKLGQAALATVKIYNQAGNMVWSSSPGRPQTDINWSGRDLKGQAVPVGIYFGVVESNGQAIQQAMVKLQ